MVVSFYNTEVKAILSLYYTDNSECMILVSLTPKHRSSTSLKSLLNLRIIIPFYP